MCSRDADLEGAELRVRMHNRKLLYNANGVLQQETLLAQGQQTGVTHHVLLACRICCSGGLCVMHMLHYVFARSPVGFKHVETGCVALCHLTF